MWAYYDSECMAVNELLVFETKEELNQFIKKLTLTMMEKFPNDPIMWSVINEDTTVFEVEPITAKKALKHWFD